MKQYFSIILFLLLSLSGYAQKSVTLVVIGEGDTKEEATQSALRSAIEQSFGTFISSNTTILDEELIKDEIVSVSSGNIQNYKELSFSRLDNGHCSVSIEATVSLAKLTKFAQSKGSECELAGEVYGANLQLASFYKEAETVAIDNLVKELMMMLPSLYEYSLDVSEPKPISNGGTPTHYKLVFDIKIKPNDVSNLLTEVFLNTLQGLSMDYKTASTYKKITGISPSSFTFCTKRIGNVVGGPKINLRNAESIVKLQSFVNDFLFPSMKSFYVLDNLGEKHYYNNGSGFNEYPEMTDESVYCLWKNASFKTSFSITIPMNEIGKYRSFSVHKDAETVIKKKSYMYQFKY